MPFCPKCGERVNDSDKFCVNCGFVLQQTQRPVRAVEPQKREPISSIVCPRCQSPYVKMDTFQEQGKSVTTGVSSTVLTEKRHGFFWWFFIGWWWSIIKLFFWIIAFIPMAIIRAGRRKKYVGKTTTVNTTVNNIQYTTVCTCQNCGYVWKKK